MHRPTKSRGEHQQRQRRRLRRQQARWQTSWKSKENWKIHLFPPLDSFCCSARKKRTWKIILSRKFSIFTNFPPSHNCLCVCACAIVQLKRNQSSGELKLVEIFPYPLSIAIRKIVQSISTMRRRKVSRLVFFCHPFFVLFATLMKPISPIFRLIS